MSSADHGLLAPIWSGRPVAAVTGDPALLDAMIEVEVALARAQGTRTTPAALPDAAALAPEARSGGNPVLPLLEALHDPHLHQGPTSQDILDTALMITARRALTFTLLDLDAAIAATTRLATEHRDTPMAARTLTQQAVPTTFGLKAAGWRHMLITARRALAATAQALPVQLGGAGGTLASFVALAEASGAPTEQGTVTTSAEPATSTDPATLTDTLPAGVKPAAEQLPGTTAASPTSAGPAAGPDLPSGDAWLTSADAAAAQDLPTGDTLPTGTTPAPLAQQNLPPGDTLPTGSTPAALAQQDLPSRDTPPIGTGQVPLPFAEPVARPGLRSGDTSPTSRQSLPAADTLPTGATLRLGAAASDTLTTAGSAAEQPASAASERIDPAVAASLALVSRLAANLDLAIPLLPWHVLRTPIADLASSLALASGALGKVAADVLVLSRTEIGEVSEGVGGVSSTMPHKANPVRATLIAGAARQVPALASVLFASVAAEDERPAGAWHAEWQPLREALRLVGGAAATAAELLGALRVHPERMAANLARLDLAEARRFAGREVSDPRDYLGAACALVDRALKETP